MEIATIDSRWCGLDASLTEVYYGMRRICRMLLICFENVDDSARPLLYRPASAAVTINGDAPCVRVVL